MSVTFSRVAKLVVLLITIVISLPAAQAAANKPQRIVSLAPAVTEILFTAGLGNRVVGVTNVCDRPADARKKAKVGSMANPSLEAIVALKPDLVILASKENPKELAGRLTSLGIRTHTYRTTDLNGIPVELRTIGKITGNETALGTMAERIEASIRTTRQHVQQNGTPAHRKVLFVVWPNPLVVAGPGSIIDDALTTLGLRNIADDSRAPYPRLSLEVIIGRQPEIIIFGPGHAHMKENSQVLLKRLGMLEAVRKRRICYLKEDGLYRPGSRIPEAFAELERCVNMQ